MNSEACLVPTLFVGTHELRRSASLEPTGNVKPQCASGTQSVPDVRSQGDRGNEELWSASDEVGHVLYAYRSSIPTPNS